MAWQATEVTLVGGEKVKLALDSVCNQKQTFIRMGKRLIAGVVEDPSWQGIYIWQEVDGVFHRLGDIVFKNQEDGSVIWDVYPWTHNTPEFEKRAAAHLAKQGELHALGCSTGNHMEMLSVAPGVAV